MNQFNRQLTVVLLLILSTLLATAQADYNTVEHLQYEQSESTIPDFGNCTYKKKTVKKGKHASKPLTYARSNNFYWKIKFTNSCEYDLNTVDQYDWNKLVGIKDHYFRPTKETMMIGWRYNKSTDLIELIPYQHYKSGRTFHDQQIISVKSDQEIVVQIKRSRKTWNVYIWNETTLLFHESYNKRSKRGKGYEILHWFGGNRTAPQDISIYYMRKK